MSNETHTHMKPQKPTRPSADTWCFCKDPACDGWNLYRTHHLNGIGIDPTDEDIALDKLIAAAYTAEKTRRAS